MKFNKCIAIFLLSMLTLTGCGNKTFDRSMEEGKIAIASKEYEKAEGMFSLALKENKNDKEASALHKQTEKLIELVNLKDEGKIDESLKNCEEIEKIESDSDCVKKEARDLKQELSKDVSNEKIKEVKAKMVEIGELIDDKNYNDAKVELDKLIKELQENKGLKSELEVANKLLKECNENIEKAKKMKNTNTNKVKKTLCSCGKNYLEDNKQWKGEDKCDDCVNEIVGAHADNYACAICGAKTQTLCEYDQCQPLCESDMGYYCDCGEYHHTQQLCPIYDR